MNDVTAYYIESALSQLDQSEIDSLNTELKELCDENHSCDCSECPVYQCNAVVPNKENSRWGCDCFKNGEKMRQYIIQSYT